MNACHIRKDGGFAMIMAMIILFVLTILVVNAVRGSSLSEQMAGSYMDRNRAMQAAEQALREGETKLMTLNTATNDPICLDPQGCKVAADGSVTLIATQVTTMPGSWDATADKTQITQVTDQATNAWYQIAFLAPALMDPTKVTDGCMAYSIMGKGQGIDTRTEVILQTVAYVCPT
jgi:type IV pilus assembly protein PilX